MAQQAMPLHPALAPLAFMLGTWRGQGEGGFPTIQAFRYEEEVQFWHSGKGLKILKHILYQRSMQWLHQKCFWSPSPCHYFLFMLLPVMAYTQKTWKLASGEPMHSESGYWRPKTDGSIEVIIAQSTGLAEVQKGSFNAEEKSLVLESEIVANASKVKSINRSFKVTGDELEYCVSMSTNSHSLQPHLRAVLKKVTV